MATREVFDCDTCEKKDLKEHGTVTVHTRRYMDAAGSMDTDWEAFHLCIDCLQRELMVFLKKLSFEAGDAWAKSKRR